MRNKTYNGQPLYWLILAVAVAIFPAMASAENEGICFSFPDLSGEMGTQVAIPLAITGADSIFAIDATISYPADKLSTVSVVKTDFSANMFLVENLNTPGEILVAMAGGTDISGDGELFQITFELTGNSGQHAGVQLTAITVNDMARSECIQNGSITIDAVGRVYVNKDDETCGGKSPCSPSIGQAYLLAGDGAVIMVVSGVYAEAVTLDQDRSIELEGGYDSPYASQTGMTTVDSMAINEGTVVISGVALGEM